LSSHSCNSLQSFPRRLVVGTRNAHKLTELGEILAGVELVPLPEDVELPPEDAETFAGNARGKALAAHRATGMVAIADDSGIEARALGGRPGVRSARYAGGQASDEENLELLLREVGAAGDDRRVAYICVIALAGLDAAGTEDLPHAPVGATTAEGAEAEIPVFEARCEGVLAERSRGTGGFGYDPAFIPQARIEEDLTMAELSAAEKHAISHRAAAARMLVAHLEAVAKTSRRSGEREPSDARR